MLAGVVQVVARDVADGVGRLGPRPQHVRMVAVGEDLPAAHIRGDRVLWLGDRAALGTL